MAVTDSVLLLVMLVGLLRIRHHSGTTFGVTHLLWRQVWVPSSLNAVISVHLSILLPKGVIWASLSVVAEVPPAVSLVTFKPFSFSVDFM